MKIYFYADLLTNNDLFEFTASSVKKHKLLQQFKYYTDIIERLSAFATVDPNDADYFFVPVFLAAWQFENVDPEKAFSLVSKQCRYVNRGRHLIVGTGDFGQRYQSKYEMQSFPRRAYRDKYSWLDNRFTILALESTRELNPNDLSFFPYMVENLPDQKEIERELLCSFKGEIYYSNLPATHIRGGELRKYATFLKEEGFHVFSNGETGGLADLTSRELMQRSVFTLCPAGYGQWSYRFIEALSHGSIPILLADSYELPFSKNIDWNSYVLHIKESDVRRLPEIIKSLHPSIIKQMQENIRTFKEVFSKENCLSMIADELKSRTKEFSADWAMPRMRSPSEMGIICIDITNKCDLACSNCTRLLVNQDYFWEMTLDNFRLACRSLADFPGVIAVIGGNPCMHSKFSEISKIFAEEIPQRRKRGIWTNNAFKHSNIVEEVYGHFNLNPHGMERGMKSLQPIHEKMKNKFNSGFYDSSSEHAPLLVAVKDLYDEEQMWSKIVNCDVNKKWSAAIIQNNGKLRAYFCEVAASFDLSRNEDHGLPVYEGWWRSHMNVFAEQVKQFCPGCGAAAKLKGNFDVEEIDTYSVSNKDIAIKSEANKNRKIVLIDNKGVEVVDRPVTKYHQNAH